MQYLYHNLCAVVWAAALKRGAAPDKRAWSSGENARARLSFALAECNASARKATQEGSADILSAGLREQDPRQVLHSQRVGLLVADVT